MPCQAGSSTPCGGELEVYKRLPVRVVRGEGCRLWDEAGREYLDLYGGHAVAALGYGHPALVSAIQEQAETLLFQTNAVQLAIRDRAISALIGCAPSGLRNAFLVNSGAEANENALRLAFWKTGRSRVACVQGGFHGRTAASGAVTDHNETWYGFPRTPFEVDAVDPDRPEDLDCTLTQDTAAFIFEPVQGVAGAVNLGAEFVAKAASLCQERGIVLIADEVQTGIGRTGTMFCVEQLDVLPDILTVAKGLGGGFPVAAVLCSDEIGRNAGVGKLGTTFGGGPIAAAAMEAVLAEVSKPGFLEGVRHRSETLRQACLQAGAEEVSGRGFLLGIKLDRPAKPVRMELLERGFLTGDAKHPNVIRLLPPLILSESEIHEFADVLREVLV